METLLDSLYDAAAGARDWTSCCAELTGMLGATSSMLFIEDRTTKMVTPLAMPDYTEAVIALYERHYHRIDPFIQATQGRSCLNAALGTSLVDAASFRKSEIWNDFIAKSARSFHFLCGLGELKPGLVFGLAVHRTPEAESFGNADAAILQHTLPHFRRALQLGARLEQDRLTSAALSATLALEHSSLGILVCDGHANIRMINEAGEAFCKAQGVMLKSQEAAFGFRRFCDVNHMLKVIACTARGGEGGRIRLGPAARPAIVTICRLPRAVAGAYSPRQNAGNHLVLMIVEAPGKPTSQVAAQCKAFGLTAAETDVAVLLLDGRTAADVASTRDVNVTTVRTQIRSILDKAAARNLRELAGMLATRAA